MSTSIERDADFDFTAFIDHKRSGSWGRDDALRYAYRADVTMMRSFSRIRPVELAAAAVVRTSKEWMRSNLLGRSIKVGPTQFPRIHAIAAECARTLTVPTPTIYIQNSRVVNAYTYGTDEESFIVIHSALVDHFDEDELRFVIGHETGHIQNKHVVYNTAILVLTQGAGLFLAWLVEPALLALRTWFRAAEVTCDRAGLLCCRDLDAASRSFMKMAAGSTKLYEQMNMNAFLDQYEEGQASIGRLGEAFETHPYLPKRIHAMRVFAESEIYRKAAGLGEGGLDMEEVDRRTTAIIQVSSSATEPSASKNGPPPLGDGGKDEEKE